MYTIRISLFNHYFKFINYKIKKVKLILILIQVPKQLIIHLMIAGQQQRQIKIQIYHQLIGNHTFQFNQKNHLNELRAHIMENSPLCIFENFHFQFQGKPLYQYNEISEIFKGDSRLNILFDSYDYYSSKFHQSKVKEVLQNPIQWGIVNTRDIGLKTLQQENQVYPNYQLEKIFDSPFSSNFLGLSQKRLGEFSNMINLSGFNPVPSYRKFKGDLYYIHIKTLEETDIHITASTDGFYVNMSSQASFNPEPNSKYTPCISLLDLLYQVSPKFKIKFQQILKTAKITQFQRIVYSFKPIIDNFVWIKDSNGWKKTNCWKNDCYNYDQKRDFSIIKDWVEIFNYYRNAPMQSIYDKMSKQKLKYKIYQQFTQCAKEGVVKIFNGSLQPLNTALKFLHQIFYYEYLLFYFLSDEFDESNDLLTSQEINRDLQNLSYVELLQPQKFYISNMIVIHYRGYKIAVRTIPGCFINQDQNIKNIKQLLTKNNQIQKDQSFVSLIKKISKQLGLEGQNIFMNEQGKQIVVTHPQIKGYITKDNKKFLLDCTKLSPRDLNFKGSQNQCSLLRPQLMKLYNNKQKCHIPYNVMIGTKYKFKIDESKYKMQQKKLISLAKFAKQMMIPLFIDSFDDDMRKYLSDSKNIINNLHRHGLSSKYLGMVYLKAAQKNSHHVKIMIERVILIKSLKQIFKTALKQTSLYLHKSVIKHLMNCVFNGNSSDGNAKNCNQEDLDGLNTKKSKKKKVKESQTFFEISFSKPSEKYTTIKVQEFWEEVKNIAMIKFKHNLSQKSTFFAFQFSKTALLRDLCLGLGIQLEKKDYFSGNASFTQDNILIMIPKVRIVINQPKELIQLIQQGDRLVYKYQFQEAFQTYNRALQYVFTSFNGVHQKLALINKKIAIIYYKVGDADTAVMSALNSCQIYETLLGQDHVQTIETYFMVGVFHFARKKFAAAEHYMLKALFLAKFAYSQCYPQIIVMYLNLSTVYQTQKKFTDAIMSLFLALNTSIKVFGEKHLHTAIIFTALASLHFQIPDIEQCIRYQLKAIEILQSVLALTDQRVIQAKNACESYKNLQNSKKIREVHDKEQKNLLGSQVNGKVNFKLPFYEFREKSTDSIWKKSKKMKFFL